MKRISFCALLIGMVLLLACKKADTPLPIEGTWNFSGTALQVEFGRTYLFQGVPETVKITRMEVSNDKILFHSSDGIAPFKIKKWSVEEVKALLDTSAHFSFDSNKPFNIHQVYKLELRDKKNQRFLFEYYCNKDKPDEIYGDYWIKGQIAAQYDKPNLTTEYKDASYYQNGKLSTGMNDPIEKIIHYKRN